MTATLFIRVSASIQGCLRWLLSSFLSLQRCIDFCTLCGRKKEDRKGEMEAGKEEGRGTETGRMDGRMEGRQEEREGGRKRGKWEEERRKGRKEGREEWREEGRREGGRIYGRKKEVSKLEILIPIEYDDSIVLIFHQIWKLFLQNKLSLLHLTSSWEPYKGLRSKYIEMDIDKNTHCGLACYTSGRKFSAFITCLCSFPDSQVPTGEPFACSVCVTG